MSMSQNTSTTQSNTKLSKKPQQRSKTPIGSQKIAQSKLNLGMKWTYSSSVGLVTPQDNETAEHLYNLSLAPVTSSLPWPNLTTLAYEGGRFYSGYRNQMMFFTIVVLEAKLQDHGQILLDSINFKDTYGSDQYIKFQRLWDVEHWNRHYPKLPRLVSYDPILHDQYNFPWREWYKTRDRQQYTNARKTESSTTPRPVRPYSVGGLPLAAYIRYAAKLRGPYVERRHRNPADILMLQGALTPSPELSKLIQTKLDEKLLPTRENNDTHSSLSSTHNIVGDYMAVHARVEPDMQRHPMCTKKKVLNLADIFRFLETKWPDPPVSRVFLPINRQYMEKEGSVIDNTTKPSRPKRRGELKETNWIAVENLKVLNRARDHGLWGGRVPVIEFGANSLNGTEFQNRASTTGSMLNFFIGIQAKIFIGTEVSSFSHDLLATRFYRGQREKNYRYLPDGLQPWIPPDAIDPPGFKC